MGELGAVAPAEALERPELVDDVGLRLEPGHIHDATAEADQVGERGVGPDLHAGVMAEAHRLVHDARVSGVEPARQVGRVEQRDEHPVLTEIEVAETLAEVRVQVDDWHSSWVLHHEGEASLAPSNPSAGDSA